MNKVPINITDWGLHEIRLHPLVHDYFQGVYVDELVEWFARHGYAISKTWPINTSSSEYSEKVIVHVPEELILAFKLRWAK